MVGRKKKTKICDKVSEEEDRISQLPEPLICEILSHLSTKDVLRTSVLSTKWKNLWQWVPGVDLDSRAFSNFDAFVSFSEKFLNSHRESWIRKLRLSMIRYFCHDKSFLTRWFDAVTTFRIQHLDIDYRGAFEIPQSMYTCETLVHLRLCWVDLSNAEFVSLPCLKIMHLEKIGYSNDTTLQKLISGSPVLEDLIISSFQKPHKKVLQLRSQMLKRIDIECFRVVIDVPLLQCLRTKFFSTKNFEIINLGSSTKLDVDGSFSYGTDSRSPHVAFKVSMSRYVTEMKLAK